MHRSSRSAKRPGRCNSRIRPAGRSVLRKTYMSFHQLLLAEQCECQRFEDAAALQAIDRALVDLRSEEHTSELQSLMRISYAVFCLKKKTIRLEYHTIYKNY